jgi:hypothetical protein
MELEKLGIPTVTLVSKAFEVLAKQESIGLGFRNLTLVILPHPFGNLDREAVRAIGDGAYARVIRGISSGPEEEEWQP